MPEILKGAQTEKLPRPELTDEQRLAAISLTSYVFENSRPDLGSAHNIDAEYALRLLMMASHIDVDFKSRGERALVYDRDRELISDTLSTMHSPNGNTADRIGAYHNLEGMIEDGVRAIAANYPDKYYRRLRTELVELYDKDWNKGMPYLAPLDKYIVPLINETVGVRART